MSGLPPGVLGGPEICFNATDDNDNRLIDEGCEVRQGPLHVVIAWPDEQADVDLWVTGPDGQVAQPGSKTQVGLVRSGDCPTVDRACPVHRYESVHVDADEVVPGTYRVVVRLESTSRAERLGDVPLQVRLGVRTPEETRGLLVTFPDQGIEASFTFEVPRADGATDLKERDVRQKPVPSRVVAPDEASR